MKRLLKIKNDLKVGKGRTAAGSKVRYSFRNASDILEAVKPMLYAAGLDLVMTETAQEIGGRLFIYSTAAIYDTETGALLQQSCSPAEIGQHIGMSAEQASGSAISYARKYVLGGLFDIDDSTIDPDAIDGDAARAFNYIASNTGAQQFFANKYGVEDWRRLKPAQLVDIYKFLVENNKID